MTTNKKTFKEITFVLNQSWKSSQSFGDFAEAVKTNLNQIKLKKRYKNALMVQIECLYTHIQLSKDKKIKLKQVQAILNKSYKFNQYNKLLCDPKIISLLNLTINCKMLDEIKSLLAILEDEESTDDDVTMSRHTIVEAIIG